MPILNLKPDREGKDSMWKEYAEQSLRELLGLLSERLGGVVTLDNLATDYGEVGADVNKYFELVMMGRDELEMTINHAHLIKRIDSLKLQTEISH